jgi:hypothetical protein
MLAFLRNIFLWLSFSLLLMHSLVPHHHNDHINCNETHISAPHTDENPLAQIFQTQLGAGHLENFFSDNTQPTPLTLFIQTSSQGLSAVTFCISTQKEIIQDFNFHNPLLEQQLPLRAPPMFS